LAWLIAEDDGAKKKVVALLADRDEDLSLVRGTLQGVFLYGEESILVRC
jgi:beta-catenin-like protein 1